MDCIIYLVMLAVIGFAGIGRTQSIVTDSGIADTGATVSAPVENLPIGSNLGLLKEAGAYTLILEELGLIKC